MPVKKKKPPFSKKTSQTKAVSFDDRDGFVKADSVISRRNQNGTVILMRMDKASLFYKIDGIAAEVWGCIETPKNLKALADHFDTRYPAKSKSLRRDVEALIRKLSGFELLSPSTGPFSPDFPGIDAAAKKPDDFGDVQGFDLEQIESEILNESIYLDVFAGSDLKLKSDITPIRDALKKVTQLDGITHRWKRDALPARLGAKNAATSRTVHAGLIAQQVALHMPELVRADRDTGYLAVEYRKLNSYLVEAIKDLDRLRIAQEERIRKLEERVLRATKRARRSPSSAH